MRIDSWNNYIGQENIKEALRIALMASQKRSKPLGHILFIGTAGTGKTTLANIIAREQHGNFNSFNGATTKKDQLVDVVNNLSPGDVVFIDEIHRISKWATELLYPVMEDFKYNYTSGSFNFDIEVAPFTLIGASTELSLISKPLRDRFINTFYLNPYTEQDMQAIVGVYATELEIELPKDVIAEIAKESRQTPRYVVTLIRNLKDFQVANNVKNINLNVLRYVYKLMGFDEKGITSIENQFLSILKEQPASAKTLAYQMGVSPRTLEEVVMPHLYKKGLIDKTTKGVSLTSTPSSDIMSTL